MERSFAHCYETGGMRRTHLRRHDNIIKRLLIHASAFNLGLVMRKMSGYGTPRGMQDRGNAFLLALHILRMLLATMTKTEFLSYTPNRGNIHQRCSAFPYSSSFAGIQYSPKDRTCFNPGLLGGFLVFLLYTMRRVDCRRCGVVAVEEVPWGDGKRTLTKADMLFLALWARRLSWKETADAFRTSWDKVCHGVEHVVTWGLEHRTLGQIDAIGVDEIQYS